MLIRIVALVLCSALFTGANGQKDSVSLPTVTKFECPTYPEKARSLHIEGVVTMQITTDGHGVSGVKVLRAAKVLAPYAEANVRTWKFTDHLSTTFTVTYDYAFEGNYKQDPATRCEAKMDLPKRVKVSTELPLLQDSPRPR
jgi:Gram-negative bacterial TonB protein C-terminal